jgi:5-formyltetrahydrofolate cyclo-ligase
MASGRADDVEAVIADKQALRERVWTRLKDAGVTRFPGAQGRIPNFVGAEAAAEKLRSLDVWHAAESVKANPDSPQWPVRQRALEDGKVVYMAVPRLAEDNPFFVLDPDRLEESPRSASSIKGASRVGRTAPVEDLEPVGLVVVGSVAVSEDGARLGKGGGFSDLEYVIARAAGLISAETTVATTVHELQIVGRGDIPMTDHDVPVDLVVTPDRVLDCRDGPHRHPDRIVWEDLSEEKIAAIPLLQRLRVDRSSAGERYRQGGHERGDGP